VQAKSGLQKLSIFSLIPFNELNVPVYAFTIPRVLFCAKDSVENLYIDMCGSFVQPILLNNLKYIVCRYYHSPHILT
jgi:hypothetical protein